MPLRLLVYVKRVDLYSQTDQVGLHTQFITHTHAVWNWNLSQSRSVSRVSGPQRPKRPASTDRRFLLFNRLKAMKPKYRNESMSSRVRVSNSYESPISPNYRLSFCIWPVKISLMISSNIMNLIWLNKSNLFMEWSLSKDFTYGCVKVFFNSKNPRTPSNFNMPNPTNA